MSIFALDAVRNASVNHRIEPILEDVREEIATFPFSADVDLGDVEDVLAAYDMARPRLNVLASLLEDFSGRTGADISIGLGFLPVLLTRFGITTVGTEADLGITRFARDHGVEVREYRLGRIPPPFDRESLDFLVLAEVLEHLKLSPIPVLRELAQLLRPGGHLLLTTPNIARLAHLDALAAGENFLEPFPQDLPLGVDATDLIEHVREYSVREVVDAVEAVGLQVERVLMTGWGEAGYNPLPNPYANEIIVVEAVSSDYKENHAWAESDAM